MARSNKKTAKKKSNSKTVTYNGLSSYKKLSTKKLGLIVAAFSVVGLATLIYTQAATVSKVITLQAESLQYPQERATSNKTSGLAELYWTTTGVGSFSLPGETKKLTVTAHGSQCNGAPQLHIRVDGKTIVRKEITSTKPKAYEFGVKIPKGDHNISVAFTNDEYRKGKCDRNLFVDKLDFVSSVERKPSNPTQPTTPTPTPPPAPAPAPPTPSPSPEPTPTPSAGVLKWAPPTLSSPTNVDVPAGSGSYTAKLDASKDYVLKMPNSARGPLVINGGRNVIVIGGAIHTTQASSRAVYITANKGTVHLEGLLITGANVEYDAFAINSPDSIVQLQNISAMNVRGSVNNKKGNGGWHGDIVQPWGGVKALRIDKMSGSTNYQGLFLRPDLGAIGSIDLSRINLGFDNVNVDGGGHLLWLTTGDSQTAGSVVLDEVYLTSPYKGGSTSIGSAVWPQTGAAFPAVVAGDGSVSWPKLPTVSGKAKPGLPAGGAYVPTNSVGTGYKSPGYR